MQVQTGAAADKSGHVRSGQRVLQVNGIPMLSATHAEALNAMRQSVDCLTLMVCDGYNADAYLAPEELTEKDKDKKRAALLHRKSRIFDPSACVAY